MTEKNINSNIMDLSEHIKYSDNSVVSKIIIKKKEGSVTLFSFDKGEQISEHTVPYEALVQILDGEAEITVAGINNIIKTGQSLILPANVPHALNAVQRFKMLLTMIKN